MKVSFTQEEVEAIVLAHVQKFFPQANQAEINTYRADFCSVIFEEPKSEE